MDDTSRFVAFVGTRLLAAGALEDVLVAAKQRVDQGKADGLLVFDDSSGRQVDYDLRGTVEQVLERARPAAAPTGRGRPKLGVQSREVTLLPRHWEWLEEQPNGASAALRRLVDEARKRDPGQQRTRLAREAAHRFMTTMAGDRPGYEEALRALYAGDREVFTRHTRRWPADVRAHAERLARAGFGEVVTDAAERA